MMILNGDYWTLTQLLKSRNTIRFLLILNSIFMI